MSPLRELLQRLQHLPLNQQLALPIAACCLIATCTLVAVSARSNQFVQEALLSEYGEAVAQQLARRLANDLMTEDRLAVTAELARVAELDAIARARAEGVDGATLADVGQSATDSLTFSASILIDGNIAGEVRVEVAPSRQSEARRQMMFALAGLSLLLSIAVYGIARPLGQHLARRIDSVTDQLAEVVDVDHTSDNELARLQHRMAALPLDLLKPWYAGEARDEHYEDTAVLFVTLKSLPGYVDTLDGPRLHRYVALMHRLVFGAAGFYGGQLEVVRQFGLAVYFSGSHKVGSPALRAASCAWLLQQAAAPAEEVIRLSLRQGLAVAHEVAPHGPDVADAEGVGGGLCRILGHPRAQARNAPADGVEGGTVGDGLAQ